MDEQEKERQALEDDCLDGIQGGAGYATVNVSADACGRYFPAMNQAATRQCGSCFYFHPLEQETGYCSR